MSIKRKLPPSNDEDEDIIFTMPKIKIESLEKSFSNYQQGFLSEEAMEKILLESINHSKKAFYAVHFYKGVGEKLKTILDSVKSYEGLLLEVLIYYPLEKDLVNFLYEKTKNFSGCFLAALKSLPGETTLLKNLEAKTNNVDWMFELAAINCPENDDLLLKIYKRDKMVSYISDMTMFDLCKKAPNTMEHFLKGMSTLSDDFIGMYIKLGDVETLIPIFCTDRTRVPPEGVCGSSSMTVEQRKMFVNFDFINDECFICLLNFENLDDQYWMKCGHRIHQSCREENWFYFPKCMLH